MKYYHCNICKEPHAILEETDMAMRKAECDAHGHVKNCSTQEKDGTYWCAYCARPITKEEFTIAMEKP